MTITNQPTGRKRQKAAPAASSRLPSARERRPALAALAVLLIAGGAVLAGWLALRQSQTASYLMITSPVSEGEQIEGSNLGRIELPKEGVNFVSFDDASSIVDTYAQADLLKGTVLAPGMTGDRPELRQDESRIGLELGPDQYPRGLTLGDQVNVLLLDGSGENNAARLSTTGVVRYLNASDTGSGAEIDVVIASECSAEFASGSTDNQVTLAQISSDAPTTTCQPVASPEKPK